MIGSESHGSGQLADANCEYHTIFFLFVKGWQVIFCEDTTNRAETMKRPPVSRRPFERFN